jgi:hypothetical protein
MQYTSIYAGDLVAKCYHGRRKLVWEVLNSHLKNKMEIEWSDITAIKETCSKDEDDILDVVVSF